MAMKILYCLQWCGTLCAWVVWRWWHTPPQVSAFCKIFYSHYVSYQSAFPSWFSNARGSPRSCLMSARAFWSRRFFGQQKSVANHTRNVILASLICWPDQKLFLLQFPMISGLFWNVRGVGNSFSLRRIKRVLCLHHFSLLALFEPMIPAARITDIQHQLHFDHCLFFLYK